TAEASVSSFAQGCSAPIQGENLELDRVTVGFNQSTGERFVLEDRWTVMEMTILIEFEVILLNMLEVILLNKFEVIFLNKFELIPM
ncbi:unnamed protein product, partial [Cladocopium goreaui]